jgi:hypothetical protein
MTVSERKKRSVGMQVEIVTAGLVSTAFLLLATISRLMMS